MCWLGMVQNIVIPANSVDSFWDHNIHATIEYHEDQFSRIMA